MRGLLDTNAVIYLQKGLLAAPLPKGDYAVSIITEMELLSFHRLSEQDEQWLHRFLAAITVINLNETIKLRTIQLRRHYRWKLPDALIVATAIESNRILVTADSALKGAQNEGLTLWPLQLYPPT